MDISRRRMLKGMISGGIVTLGLPLFDVCLNGNGTALAAGGGLPTRFGLFFWGNGMLPQRWVPPDEGVDWTPSDQLAPLAALREQLTVVTGLWCDVPNIVPHGSGFAAILTGAPMLHVGDRDVLQAPTIDQVIANEIGGETRFRSIETGVVASPVSFSGLDSPNPPELNPYTLFERVFGVGFRLPGDDTPVDPRIGLRRSVLDAVLSDANDLRRRLGQRDQIRMDRYLETVRGVELQLARLEEDPPQLDACAIPETPLEEYPDIEGRPQLAAKNRAMCDILALALACDQTRVFSPAFTTPVDNALYPNATAGHHQLTHDEPGEQPQVHDIVVNIMGEYAYMLEALRAIPEGDGTLLDHCAILGTSEISEGRTHSIEEMPVLIGGSACGQLKPGHFRMLDVNASRLLLTLGRTMGLRLNEFGVEGARVDQSLTEIEA